MDTKDRHKTVTQEAVQAARMESDLRAIQHVLRKPVEAQMARGALTIPQTAVMQEAIAHQGINMKELSKRLSLAHSTVSGIVDRLEKRGMLERRRDGRDGRISSLFPTAVVTKFLREELPALKRGPLQAALQRATPAECNKIEQALRRLRELLEQC
jgi:MarR family transcriptional regulator, organic hydroperoxide resistance regulator